MDRPAGSYSLAAAGAAGVRRTAMKTSSRVGIRRALTVRQPWAWAIIPAGKDIENRPGTRRLASGTIGIQAGMGLDSPNRLPRGAKKPRSEDLIHGAIIGVVDIVGVVDRSRSKWFDGPHGWVLRNPRALQRAVRCTG